MLQDLLIIAVEKIDLRSIITWKRPPPKLELFTEKPRPNPSQDIRNKSKEIAEKNNRFNISEKIRKIKKSAVHSKWENCSPPE